eukprot:Gb_10967 [translate_table: standard]
MKSTNGRQKLVRLLLVLFQTLVIIKRFIFNSAKTSKKAWEMLFDMYESQDVNTRLYLRTFFQMKMIESKNMAEHINCFKTLLEQLAIVGSTIQDVDAVITLLGSLFESYESLVISLSMQSKLTL